MSDAMTDLSDGRRGDPSIPPKGRRALFRVLVGAGVVLGVVLVLVLVTGWCTTW